MTRPFGLVLLAGGKATRMGDATLGRPKAVLPVTDAGRCLLRLYLEQLKSLRLPCAVVTEESKVFDLRRAVEGIAGYPRWVLDPGGGTAPALLAGLLALDVERVVVANCDTLVPFTITEAMRADHMGSVAVQHLAAGSVQNAGLIGLNAEATIVTHWGESAGIRPSQDQLRASSSGIYQFDRNFLKHLLHKQASLENEALPSLVTTGDVTAKLHASDLPIFDFGTADRWAALRGDALLRTRLVSSMGLAFSDRGARSLANAEACA